MLWLALSVMTGLAVLSALWPLAWRRAQPRAAANEGDFYRAQLEEIRRDVERGALPADEAASARAETGRRLIAASASVPAPGIVAGARARRGIAAAGILVAVPLIALSVYLTLGRPDARDAPLASRNVDINAPGGVELAIARIEAKLAADPSDARGWRVLAPVYMRLDRYDDAVAAYKQVLRLDGETAGTLASLGEATLAAASGVVTTDARADFDRALKLQPGLPMARFYVALATEQDGDKDGALAVYRELATLDDGTAAWMLGVRNRLAALDGSKAGAAKFSPEQLTMIRQMVQGLADRLAKGGGSAEDWTRLIRAYAVLQDNVKAKTALADARGAFARDSATLGSFDALAQDLGLQEVAR